MCHKLRIAAKRGKEVEVEKKRDSIGRFILSFCPSIGVSKKPIYSLSSSGASRKIGFSRECVGRLKLELKEFLALIKVTTPSRSLSITSKACHKVEIVFEDRISMINLICIPLKGIDVMVCMDWLAASNAILDYVRKLVSLLVLSAGTSSTEQLRFLSIMQAEKLIKEGYDDYMMIFAVSSVYDKGIEKIGVVSEFLKVFSEKMSRLPLKREVEFLIDLVLGTKLISKAPCSMSPSELSELKRQIKDLLDKGFIKPSISP
ncbi:uncharacterized protein LOC129286561 [Prosopis cineraria]|uniref:uncharacterized protein LOC129286561 n=1 Tax=Prosopis cineraria TaxID=364024 RepID=UPI00240ED5A5|nr:uncharacterized protein LOC129286561 [Prosopis cineraria]